jgi:RNA polymerase sigma-70 factor (ECF subfamily)
MESESVDALVMIPARVARAETFDDFYRVQFPRLVPLARALCGSSIADDIAQEAMLAAYRDWRRVGDMAAPEAWARRTCANLAVSAFRRRVCELKALVRLGSPAVQSALSPDDEAFWSAVRALPKRQAQAAALRYLYDLSVAEIAETLDITQGSVKQHLSRARAALVKELQLDSGHDSGLDPEEER